MCVYFITIYDVVLHLVYYSRLISRYDIEFDRNLWWIEYITVFDVFPNEV